MESFERILGVVLTDEILLKIGFRNAKTTSIVSELRNLQPTGSTALRDSWLHGTKIIINLNKMLNSLRTRDIWNFVHIVVTDGDDNASKCSFEEAVAFSLITGNALPRQVLQTHFIGVDIQNN